MVSWFPGASESPWLITPADSTAGHLRLSCTVVVFGLRFAFLMHGGGGVCGGGRVRVRSGTRAVENVAFAPAMPAYIVLPRRSRAASMLLELGSMHDWALA